MKPAAFVKTFIVCSLTFLMSGASHAQSPLAAETLIQKSLQYLQSTQVKQTDGQKQFRGEWESYMYNARGTPMGLLGKKGYIAYDSNCFVPMSIHNILAKLFLDHGYRDATVVSMMNESMLATQGCYNNDEFNFWHEVKWEPEVAARYPEKYNITRRNPNHYNLRKKWFFNISNVVNDADDSATGFLALALNEQVNEIAGYSPLIPKPAKIGPLFDKWVDKDRTSMHMYDAIRFRPLNTGAFLTWFGKENRLPGPHLFIVKTKDGRGVPLKSNEVDCVVNANILTALTVYNEMDSTVAVPDSCAHMNKVAKDERHRKYCGTYYPNVLNVPYSYSRAYSAGVSCLEDSKPALVAFILSRQNNDGSFKGFKDNSDTLHSTIFATTALLNYHSSEIPPEVRNAIANGIQYIISNAILDESGAHWEAGVFFSAGMVARTTVFWKSAPYTTALVIELLAKAKRNGII